MVMDGVHRRPLVARGVSICMETLRSASLYEGWDGSAFDDSDIVCTYRIMHGHIE